MITPPKSWKDKETHYLYALESKWYRGLAEIQNALCMYSYDFFRSKQMKTLFLPVTTNSISSPMGLGSDSLPVEIDLFGIKTYLADSMQFMLEYGCRYFENGCFYLMPSFRGENADDRHLCQFYHSEAEIPGTLEDVISLIEEYIHYLAQGFLKDYNDLIIKMAGSTTHIESVLNRKTFDRITFDEAITFLQNIEGALKHDKLGLTYVTSVGEQHLINHYNGFVWLTNMDKTIVPFYQAECEDGIHAKCADLLMGIGETVGCGERHQTKTEVISSLHHHSVDESSYSWYVNMKEHYPLKTSGFGMGTERFILWLLQKNDIRDCQLLPRFNGSIFIP